MTYMKAVAEKEQKA